MKSADIRALFLQYFTDNGHTVVPSAPVVPQNDPTLLFVNAGMVPFKDYFLGQKIPFHKRVVSAQKCIRAGGKHNDLENVGFTARHHTFFEMLGNFSFGDYFKKDAITYAWTFLTDVLNVPSDRLWITVYHQDQESRALWQNVGVANDHIIDISTTDNFWSMGDTGPCGPCTEIFYDHGPNIAGGLPGTPEEDGDRYVEIWNLVFMQYNRLANGTLNPLPAPAVDTGMGLERIAAVMQHVTNNYDTDILSELVTTSQNIIKDKNNQAIYAIFADHIRSICFMIADGVLPDNEGRGYVLRRIIRRAVRYGYQAGHKQAFLWTLVVPLLAKMGEAYPELLRAKELLVNTIKAEEERFHQTIDRGMGVLNKALSDCTDILPGDVAFQLYDTYGFPLDLTTDIAAEQGFAVDQEGFDHAMMAQKNRARAAWSGSGDATHDTQWQTITHDLGEKATTQFNGYDQTTSGGHMVYITTDAPSALHQTALANNTFDFGCGAYTITNDTPAVIFILDQTPFYAESGGQVADQGIVFSLDSAPSDCQAIAATARWTIIVTNIQKHASGAFLHYGWLVKGEHPTEGEAVWSMIDTNRRAQIAANHSVTHLLHLALHKDVGKHVTQKGSLVTPDRMRFDISHNGPLSADQVDKLECHVNAMIRANTPVTTTLSTPEDAIKQGAMALFGEKYDSQVRVVRMGTDNSPSVELCGGTHVRATGDIGAFRIISESGISAGVRRLECLTGEAVWTYQKQWETQLQAVAAVLKTSPLNDQLPTHIQTLLTERKQLQKQLDTQKTQDLSWDTWTHNGVNILFYGAKIDTDTKTIKDMVSQKTTNAAQTIGVFLALGHKNNKATLVLGVSPDQATATPAGHLIKQLAPLLGAKGGGGRDTLAQTGGVFTLDQIQNLKDTLNQLIEV